MDFGPCTYFLDGILDNFLLKYYIMWILFLTFAKIFYKGTFNLYFKIYFGINVLGSRYNFDCIEITRTDGSSLFDCIEITRTDGSSLFDYIEITRTDGSRLFDCIEITRNMLKNYNGL